MAMKFKIHPAIGIARLGDSPTDFYISPEGPGELPIDCDKDGVTRPDPQNGEQRVTRFKDAQGRIKRQAARFRVYGYDGNDNGHELRVGEEVEVIVEKTGQTIRGTLEDIQWTVYLANKKASWYEFQETLGEHGYPADAKRRNADITDPSQRQRLIIDPGPQTVSAHPEASRRAAFKQGANPTYPTSFPPPTLQPRAIDTLGDLIVTTQDEHHRLLVLGGHGNSGSFKSGFGEPKITAYANNDGWFDDTSDGPVTATLSIKVLKVDGEDPAVPFPAPVTVPVDVPAWVLVGYPRYAPQLVDIITMEETIYDVAVRQLAYAPHLYGVAPFDGTQKPPTTPSALKLWREQATWNTEYRPWFWRDIWPILKRPSSYQWVMDFDSMAGGDPHNTTPGGHGNLDPQVLSVPPQKGEDRYRAQRGFVYGVLRKQGEENLYRRAADPRDPTRRIIGMPDLCGDNPLSNTVPSKFLRLTDTMLFLLKQWAEGKFINEREENIEPPRSTEPTGDALDRGVLGNLLGGSFCPGAEAAWIVRNPALYAEPFRIRHSPNTQPGALSQSSNLAQGLEPGDVTKYSAQPWQSDFNECSTQVIDITYDTWNKINLASIGDPTKQILQTIYWWPSHRPMEVLNTDGSQQVKWSRPIPANDQGDLLMVTAWKELGFVFRALPENDPKAKFVEVERNWPG